MQTKQVSQNYTTLDDSILVERSRDGDADAYAELYRRYLTPVYRFLFSRLEGNIAAAEDLTSQVFLEALHGLAGYREGGRFAAWLFTIARRRLIDCYRKMETASLEDMSESLLGISGGREDQDDMLHLKQLLVALDPETLELLELRFSAGLSFADLAALLGRSEGSVKMSLYRVLDGLREKWEAGHE